MKVRLLQTTGLGYFEEVMWDKPDILETEIEVSAIMTGICRSDIDMMLGNFGPLPLHMQGHEGLGQVTKVGSAISNVSIGDFVATRGEPAYADLYNVRHNEYVIVPSADPKYILEPVACGINIITQHLQLIRTKTNPRVLILGSGFLSYVAYTTLMQSAIRCNEIIVVGNHNLHMWNIELQTDYTGTFDIVIDLSGKSDIFERDILNNEALVIFGVQKTITTDFSKLLWKACTMVFPSPRTSRFHAEMEHAKRMIEQNQLHTSHFWTKGYDRDTEWQQAFDDGLNRQPGYSRGYIVWNHNKDIISA